MKRLIETIRKIIIFIFNSCLIGIIGYLIYNLVNWRTTIYYVAGIVFFIILPIGLRLFTNWYQRRKYTKNPISEIDNMTGLEFERYLYKKFKKRGYNVILTPASNDYGADLILIRKKNRCVVQAKRYSYPVGVKAVQEIIGAKRYYDADSMLIVTNSVFTDNAIRLAEVNNVMLWDRKALIKFSKN